MRKFNLAFSKVSVVTFVGVVLTAILNYSHQPVRAQTLAVIKPSDSPLDLGKLKNPVGVTTANTFNQNKLTVPSLWWAKENSENKLLDNWIAYPATASSPARVDLIVNQQIWTLLDYLERYQFINRLGTNARNYGYNVRVFNYQQELLGTYTCNFQTTGANCRINMNAQNRFRIRPSSQV
ncbi:hypothetical protein NIES4071_54490 [Calothrix sp. NIES-4071]|nr:hypothetical protein NIES4071_54490 [Calothrix sp. NIES-4071]BAZ59757.1 hypothetical protein NIES4105_54440 [Calothrix sp. NIES-4105]